MSGRARRKSNARKLRVKLFRLENQFAYAVAIVTAEQIRFANENPKLWVEYITKRALESAQDSVERWKWENNEKRKPRPR